jgi:hypothetical protein
MKLSAKLGVSAAYLGDILMGRKEPGKKLLASLGLRRESIYTKDNAR